MKTILKNTFLDIIFSKASIYMILLGSFFLMISHGVKLTLQIGSEANYKDISYYQTILFYHIFLYIFYVVILVNASADIEEEMKEKFHEVTLLYIPRVNYFSAKFISYLLSYLTLLILTGLLGSILSKAFLKILPEIKLFGALVGVGFNISFLILLLLLLSLSGLSKGASIASFLLYVLFSLLSSKFIMNLVFSSEKIAKIISILSPSVFWLQNEWLRFGVGWGFSDKLIQYLLNFGIYLTLLLILLFYKIERYECKAWVLNIENDKNKSSKRIVNFKGIP